MRRPTSCRSRLSFALRHLRTPAAAIAVVTASAGTVQATWSILVADTRTGEIVLATATCLTGQDMLGLTPVMLTGVGACTAQSFVETSGQNRSLVRNLLLADTPPQSIISSLATFDAQHQNRQYGIIDTRGRAATFSGRNNGPFAGGLTGQIGTLVYAVQGNVITGPCVNDVAVLALTTAPGSLGDKVIAAMEAVRAVGGDGRCSCNSDQPDICGCPPPGSPGIKSAHVGVMIIARAGDEDRCNAVIRTGNAPSALVAQDLDADGFPELLSVNTGASNLTLIRNTTTAVSPLPALLAAQTVTLATPPRSADIADFTGDALPDALVINGAAANVSLVRGSLSPAGAFQFATPATNVGSVGTSPQRGAILDADADGRPDFAVTAQTAHNVWLLRNTSTPGSPSFTSTMIADLGTGASPTGIVAGEFAPGSAPGAPDLVITTSGRAALAVLSGNADGTFTREPDITTVGRPTWIAARDLDNDGTTDLAVVTTAPSRFTALFRDPADPAGWVQVSTPLAAGASRIVLGDFDADGLCDAATSIGSTVSVFRNLGMRAFAPPANSSLPAAATDLLAADFDLDGRCDLATTASGLNQSVLVLKSYPGGVFDGRAGCANGSYFFLANIANQQANSPDPVFQLAEQYAAFRSTLIGVPDAIRSEAIVDRPCLLADGVSSALLAIHPRDLNGGIVAVSPELVHVEHAPDSAGAAIIGTPFADQGAVMVPLASTAHLGDNRLVIRLSHPGASRPIQLMPSLILKSVRSPDFDLSGSVDADDLAGYVNCYFGAEPCAQADVNLDGDINADDLGDFINSFFNPCG
ncbi:MAG: FG-GAP-like repeat-containing protein [Phycisphaerales bacterium]